MAIHGFIYQGVKYVAATAAGGGLVGAGVAAAVNYGVEQVMDRTLGQSSTAGGGAMFPEGADMQILSEEEARRLGLNGRNCRPRRRRRKLLTCGDKADIAFLHGNLGGGQLGRSAISAVLSRRCN